MKKLMMLLAILALSVSACGDEDHDDHADETPQAEACEHMVDGPAESATGAADQTSATSATFEHTRVDLTLAEDANGDYVGYVNYEATAAGEYYLFANNEAPLMVLDSSGNEVTIESTNTDFTECTDVAVEYLFDLEVGTYTFVFGPGADASVSYVVEEAGEHSEDGA